MDPWAFHKQTYWAQTMAFHGWELQNKGSLSTLQRELDVFHELKTSKWQFSQTAEPPAEKSKFQGTSTCGSIFLTPEHLQLYFYFFIVHGGHTAFVGL